MPVNRFDIIQKLKQDAVERCKGRLVAALKASPDRHFWKEPPPPPQIGLMKRWKTDRGL